METLIKILLSALFAIAVFTVCYIKYHKAKDFYCENESKKLEKCKKQCVKCKDAW